MKIGRRIYYLKVNGELLVDIGEKKGSVTPTTVEQDISTFRALSERTRESFDYLEIEYGQFAQDFAESNGYRVNPETKELEFSYPDPNEPEIEQPYQAPMSEEIQAIKARQDITDMALLDLMLGGM